LLHLLRRKGEYGKYLSHNLAKHRYQFGGERNPGIDFNTCEKCLNALENMDKDTMAFCDVLGNLKDTVSQEIVDNEPGREIYPEKDTDSSEYCFSGRKWLK